MIDRLLNTVHRFFSRLGDSASRAGAAITWPVERLFAVTFGRLVHAIEGLERTEDVLIGLLRVITWPFRTLWSVTIWACGLLVPQSIRQRLADAAQGAAAGLMAI